MPAAGGCAGLTGRPDNGAVNPTPPSLLPLDRPIHDLELLQLLRGSRLCRQLRTLAVIGAHRFDESALIDKVFPGLERLYVFEPLPEPLEHLHALAARDPRVRVFPVALDEADGSARFHVSSNAGESSSLLPFGTHSEHFPEVRMTRTIEVRTRRLDTLLAEQGLPAPDVLLIDVQGAEYRVLASLPPSILKQVRLIYTEVSLEAIYQGARPLADVERLLAPRFANMGFAPLNPQVQVHGNAVFTAAEDVPALLDIGLGERLRRAHRRWRQRRKGQRP